MGAPLFSKSREQAIIEMYDSYIKKYLKYKSWSYRKKHNRRAKFESFVAEPSDYEKEGGLAEPDFLNKTTIVIGGYEFEVTSDLLHDALCSLPERLLLVIVLMYWKGWHAQQIADYFDVTQRTIANWRSKALSLLKQYLLARCQQGVNK